jgi:hypothetical protein
LEERLENVEAKLGKLETDLTELKTQGCAGFAEIKLMLERQNTSKQTQIIATFGTIITAVLAFIGYLIVN